jgi:hypothetical protein
MVALIASGQALYGLYALLATLAFLVSAVLALVSSGRKVASDSDQGDIHVTWSRRLPRMPIPQESLERLKRDIQEVRNQAFVWLSQRNLPMHIEDVRANVFVPNYADAASCDVCTLKINPELQAGMDGHPDLGISFRPGQGLTGNVFSCSTPKIAKTFISKGGTHEFEEWHQLTDAHKKMSHPELRWIISFPLSTPHEKGVRRCSAVLNVDGLRHELAVDLLELLCATLVPRVTELSDTIAALPSMMVRITQQEV